MASRLRVLFVGQLLPSPPPLFGGQIRIDQLARELAKQFEVEFAGPTLTDDSEDLAAWAHSAGIARIETAPWDPFHPGVDPLWGSWGALLRGVVPTPVPWAARVRWSRALVEKLRHRLAVGEIDVVWARGSIAAEMARSAGGRRIIVDMDDFEGPLLEQRIAALGSYKRAPIHRVHARRLHRYERELTSRFQGVAVAKESDCNRLRSGRDRCWVVRNGVEIPPEVSVGTEGAPTILFVGALNYDPNQDALEWLLDEIYPRVRAQLPEAQLIVAGRGPTEPSWSASVRSRGATLIESPHSVQPLYARAHLSIVPLRRGGGTSIKTLEAMAYGRPLVATSAGVRGLAVEHGEHALIADDAEGLANACVQSLRDRPSATAMGARARALVTANYTWAQAGRIARQAVERVAQIAVP